jgi:hypothetical protein
MEDFIPSIPDLPKEFRSRSEGGKIVPGVSVSFTDDNSNSLDAELKDVATYLREKQDARKRGTATDWNPETSEILFLVFYNNFTVEDLKKTLVEAREKHGTVKQMAISLAVEEAREKRFELHNWGFEKVESRCNSRYWTYVKVLDKKSPKPRPVVDLKPEPAQDDIRPKMTAQQYADKMAELEKLRARIVDIEHQQTV